MSAESSAGLGSRQWRLGSVCISWMKNPSLACFRINPNKVICRSIPQNVEAKLYWSSVGQKKYEWWANQTCKAAFSLRIKCTAQWSRSRITERRRLHSLCSEQHELYTFILNIWTHCFPKVEVVVLALIFANFSYRQSVSSRKRETKITNLQENKINWNLLKCTSPSTLLLAHLTCQKGVGRCANFTNICFAF